jgi:hypothetical protein
MQLLSGSDFIDGMDFFGGRVSRGSVIINENIVPSRDWLGGHCDAVAKATCCS